MEEDQELKQHVCKFCSKSFPCGRSLGGHMRSHVTNLSSSAETEEKEKVHGATRKHHLSSLNNGGSGSYTTNNGGSEAGTNTGYGLRENPKKTWRIADSTSEGTLVTLADKLCKECGKGFHSWKALFGHMKCHSDKERGSNNSLEDQDSWTNNASHNHKLVMDSQSDNEATAPNRRRRSKRRRTRYMVASNPSSSSLSEVEQEQEEVAMSLIMLSRDLSPWSGVHSAVDFSDNNSAYFQNLSSVQTKIESKKKLIIPNGSSEIAKMIKQTEKKWEFGNWVSGNLNSKGKSSELLATIKSEKAKNLELDYVSALEDSEGEHGKNRVNGTESVLSKSASTNKYTSIKPKSLYSELKSNSHKNCVNKPSEAEFSKSSNKRGKFKCTTCNKIFHSYQALGGHRASHKKNKGCFASRNESSENSIETDRLSPDPTTESKLMKNSDSEYLVEHEVGAKSKEHECPICFKVFPSGQALGGHKRSHMGGGSESRNCEKMVLEEPVPEKIREFLDLNLPAATEEESNSHADSNRPWWLLEGNHKQEALVGLMSS